MSGNRKAWFTPAILGTVLGASVLALSTKAVILLVALIGAVIFANLPLTPLYVVVATLPVNLQLAGSLTLTRLLIAGALGLIVYNAFIGKGPWLTVLRWPDGFFILSYVAASTLSTLVAGSSIPALAPILLQTIIFFVVVTFVRNTRDIRHVFWTLAVMAVVQGIVAFGEVRFGLVLPGEFYAEIAESQLDVLRVVGTSGHPITLGGFFIIAVPCTIALALWARNPLLKLILAASLVLMAYAVYNTFSRSTWMGFAVMAFVALVVTSRLGRNVAIGLTVAGVLVLAVYGFSIPRIIGDLESLLPRALNAVMREKVGLMAGSESFLVRFENWAMAINMILDNPFFGVGVEQSFERAAEYLPSWARRNFVLAEAHNAFLMVASESGLIAVTAFVGLWVWAFRSLAKACENAIYRPYAKVLQIILSGQLIFIFVTPIVREIWMTLALAMAIGHAARVNAPETKDAGPLAQPGPVLATSK